MNRNFDDRVAYLTLLRKLDEVLIEVRRLAHPATKISNEWLDTEEVMQVLNISRRSISTLTRNKRLPFTKVGHRNYFKLQDIRDFLEGQEHSKVIPLSPKQIQDANPQ